MNAGRLIQFLAALLLFDGALAQVLVFPQFVNGEVNGVRNRTRVILRNDDLRDAYLFVHFRDAAGEVVQGTAVSIRPLGTADFETAGTGPLMTGSVEVEELFPLSTPISIQGSLIYDVLGSRVSVPSGQVALSHRMYVSVTESENTGIAAYNPDPNATVTARLTLLDSIGITQASKEVTVGPRQQLLGFIDEAQFFHEFVEGWQGYPWDPQEAFQGTLRIDVPGSQGLAVTALIQDRKTGALVSVPSGTSTFSTVSGGQILDLSGKPLVLRGINLGGWLVPEGYILHIPGYGSPTNIDNRILDLVGLAGTFEFSRKYRANYVTEEDIRRIAGWGFNSVRVPFHYGLLYNNSAGFLESGFELLGRVAAWCQKNRLHVILDMHCAPGGQNKDNISDSDGVEARLWTVPGNQDVTVKIWVEIARRFVHHEWILGYDLLNEPVLPSGYTNQTVRDFYVRLTSEIRKVDPHHLIFIEGNWYATDFSQLTPPFDSKLVYSFHKYWNNTTPETIQNFLSIRQSHNVPLWLGEFGENSNQWGYEVVKLMEENGIGWCWWPHKKLETISSPFSASISPEYQQVLDYWNGQAAKPSAETARTALLGMAEGLAVDKCRFLPDVVRSLLDPTFGANAKPYGQPLAIPGTINAVEFDTGAEGVAYHDTDSKRITYETWTPWNQGWGFRNDGVDIEASSDPDGFSHNIGWISDGEWMRYSVDIAQAGVYAADIRVASPGGGGLLRLSLDDQFVGPGVAIPSTGGWQQWQTVTVSGLNLPAGRHALKVHAVTGGFNLNRLSFRF